MNLGLRHESNAVYPVPPLSWAPAKISLRGLLCRHAEEFGLTTTAVEQLVAQSQITSWKPGLRILAPPDRLDLVYFLIVGAVRIELHGAGRQTMTVQIVRPGRFLGLSSLFEQESPSLFAVTAHVPSLVAMTSRGVMRQVLASLPSSRAFRLVAHDECDMRRLLHGKCRLLVAALHERLLHELETLARDFGRPDPRGILIDLPLTHVDLARLAVASRANVTRALSRLREAGKVDATRYRIVLRRDPVGNGESRIAACADSASALVASVH